MDFVIQVLRLCSSGRRWGVSYRAHVHQNGCGIAGSYLEVAETKAIRWWAASDALPQATVEEA
jgi:ATP-dependent Clp protease adapter protein ClpS